MPTPVFPEAPLYASPRWKSVTASLSEDLDLQALGGGPCTGILVLEEGVLELVPASPLDNQTSDVSPTLPVGTRLDVRATMIKQAGTTITKFMVFW